MLASNAKVTQFKVNMLSFLKSAVWPKSGFWTVTQPYQHTPVADVFGSLYKVFKLPGEQITSDPLSKVYKVTSAGKVFYVKRYTGGGKGLRRYIGRSRVRAEWKNLLLFRHLGLPTANLVAYGEQKLFSMMLKGALITEELENTIDLSEVIEEYPNYLTDRNWLLPVIDQVAWAARVLHAYRFVHNDLKWRNILVSRDKTNPQIFLIDCPGGFRWFGPMLQYRIVKDLACLDKLGKYHLSRTMRMRFYKLYRGNSLAHRLTSKDKQQIRQVLDFFEGRE